LIIFRRRAESKRKALALLPFRIRKNDRKSSSFFKRAERRKLGELALSATKEPEPQQGPVMAIDEGMQGEEDDWKWVKINE
jgi:hypothetical protein